MEDILSIANKPVVWIIAILIIGIVVFQGIKLITLAAKAKSSVGLTSSEVKQSIKTGAITALGPSVGIVVVVISLLTILGDPVTLIRIGIIGSAPIELLGASSGAEAAGTELRSEDFSAQALTAVIWVLCLGGIGWLLVTALFTKSFGKAEKKISRKAGSLMTIITSSLFLGAFGFFLTDQMSKSFIHTVVGIAAFITMILIIKLSDKIKKSWLREWGLGFSIIVGLAFAYFIM